MEQNSNSYRPLAFFLLVIGLSWIPWWIAVATAKGVGSIWVKVLIAIGGLGPTLSALVLLYNSKNKDFIRNYWQRIWNFKLISVNGYLFASLVFPVVTIAAVCISILFGKSFNQFQIVDYIRNNWLLIIPFIIYTLLLGPIPEELGWRGYWLDGLRTRFNGLGASIIIGSVWACWHIPLFFIDGYPLQEQAGNIFMLIIFFSILIPKSIIYTYIFYKNNRSTLAAILFHFMGNFTGTIIEIDLATEFIQLILFVILAGYVVTVNRDIFIDY